MTPVSSEIALIAKGLGLAYEFYRTLDRSLLVEALQRKVPIPHVTRVPTWEDTEAFVLANPDFVSAEPQKTWWDMRDSTQSRLRLMITLARHLRRRQDEAFYLFAPEVRDDPSLMPKVMSVVGEIKRALDDPALPKTKKTERVMEILQEATQ